MLVVGGGLTSAVTSCLLREELGGRCQLAVWDKARGAGQYRLHQGIVCLECLY